MNIGVILLRERGLQFNPKFQVQGVVPHQPFFLSEDKVNVLSCGIKIWAELSFILLQTTRLPDEQTDGHTGSLLMLDRASIPYSAVKTIKW